MLDFDGPRLAISKRLIAQCPKMTVIGILHALSDTQEFLEHLLQEGHNVPIVFAKPYSKNLQAITSMERAGIRVEQLDYEILENTSVLLETIKKERVATNKPLVLIDVGGYFAKPLAQLSRESPGSLPAGVVEVTTFGHNRFLERIPEINVPVLSIARSPIKDVEAAFVGESAWLAIDKMFRDVGMSAFARKVGIVGYGMIGRRVAAVAKSNGAYTRVFDTDPLKLLEARSFKHEVRLSLSKLLQDSEIIISATGDVAIHTQDILNAKDGIVLASAGSKLHEIDVAGLQMHAVSTRRISETLTEYRLPSKKRVCVLRDGAAVNFLLGSCPDQTMDLVFAEIVEACKTVIEGDLTLGKIHEVSRETRQEIANAWLQLQG